MLSWTRIATLVGCFAVAAIAAFGAVDRGRAGSPLAKLVPDGPTSNTRYLVKHAPAGSRLRSGDRVELDDPRELAALKFHAIAAGSTLVVKRISPLPETVIDEPIVGNAQTSRLAFIVFSIQFLYLGVAGLVAARGRSSGSLQLAWLLTLIVLLINNTTPAWPTWLVLANGLGGGAIAVATFVCACDFASRFAGDPDVAWARRYRAISLAIGAVVLAIHINVEFGSFFTPSTPTWVQNVDLGALVAQTIVLLVGLWLAFVKASEAERQRALWVVTAIGVGIIGFVGAVLAEFAGITEPLRDIPLLLLLAMPLGCAYAILRYRLLDIAFVVNRATVFGLTSLLVLAALALVDYGLQNLLGSWLLRTGIYVQLGLALAIGIATRPLHHRVDAFVDDLFFRQRHETERTLRAFARDVSHISDARVVLERTTATVARAARLQCSLFLMTPDGYSRAACSGDVDDRNDVDRNDSAVVRLLATRVPVDLHDVQSGMGGDVAFPMFARNRLLGILSCGGKTDGVTVYAPDELEAIGAVAQAAGLALDLLRIEALERKLEALGSDAAVFTSSIRSSLSEAPSQFVP